MNKVTILLHKALQAADHLDFTHFHHLPCLFSPLLLASPILPSFFPFLLFFPIIFSIPGSACDLEPPPPSTPRLMYGLWKQCERRVVILFALHLTGLS